MLDWSEGFAEDGGQMDCKDQDCSNGLFTSKMKGFLETHRIYRCVN